MSKKLLVFIIFCFIISIALTFTSISYKNNKVDVLNAAKSNNENNHIAIKTLNQEQIDKRGLLNKIEENPDDIAEDAKSKVDKFISKLKEANALKDDKQDAYYKQHFKNYTTDEVMNSEEVKEMTIPDKYDVYINTSRGHYIQFLVKDKNKKKPKKYIVINYNNSTDNVEGIIEYDVRS